MAVMCESRGDIDDLKDYLRLKEFPQKDILIATDS